MPMTMPADKNPLLEPWTTPFGVPPYAEIKIEHYRPALDAAMTEEKAAVEAIAADPAEPTFDNTIVALERAGLGLSRIASVFFNVAGADTNETIQAIERDVAPILARHANEISLNAKLFERIDALWQKRDRLDLSPEQRQVLDRYHTKFVRAGAGLDAADKKRLAEINERLASLGTQFGQNVLADENGFTLVLESEDDLAGLPDFVRSAAARAAKDRGLDGKHVITISRSSIEPFLQFSKRRDLRERVFAAWIRRGENDGPADNRPIIAETIALRAERARLLGYDSFADYRLADTMAKTPEAVRDLLETVWEPARKRAEVEAAALQEMAAAEGENFAIAAWDWHHYAEAVRKRRFDFDDIELKPYLQLDNIIEAAFFTANRLFGLSFSERHDVPVYHPDVRVWEVTGRDGRHVGLFFGDYFARPSKRSGAWMRALRDQHRFDGEVSPIVVNVMNFSKPPEGETALLSYDDARTLFHEFGHALHGLLSNVTYPSISGTHVARDFVELPSQLYEHWLEQPEVLGRFAIHAGTGEPMPKALLDKVLAARTFNQGWATVEYTSSALVDLDLHLLPETAGTDVVALEKATLERIGMPEAIVMRHRTPHFAHIFSGDYYAAGYYSYLWSEVLDADAFAAFREAGDVFDPETAQRLHDHIYSAGYLRDPAEAYTAFRGRLPTTEALLKKRGLDQPAG
jgi:peptidyl-dipeptidase Dcp